MTARRQPNSYLKDTIPKLFRPARASDLDEVCELLATPRRGPEYFHALFQSDPAFEPGQIRVAWTGGHIVACVKMYPRLLRIGTTVVSAGGIGNLRTEPRHQRRGLATSLLAECISAMRLQGVVLAPLFAARHTLFLRQGWRLLREPTLELSAEALTTSAEIGPRGRVIRLPQEVKIRPLEDGDLDAVLALQESVNVARTGSAVRDCAAWLGSLAALNARGARLLVAEHAGEIAGYVVAQPWQDRRERRVEVLELLLAPWLQDAWRPLLRGALAAAGDATTLSASLPRDYRALIAAALGTRDGAGDAGHGGDAGNAGDAGDAETAHERDDLMVRIVDPPRLLKEIVPLLVTRLRQAPAPDPLRLRVGPLRGGVALSIADTRIAIDTPSRDDPYALPESTFLALLFGTEDAYARLRDPAPYGGLPPLPDWAQDTLERLFPPQDWIYWRSDAF